MLIVEDRLHVGLRHCYVGREQNRVSVQGSFQVVQPVRDEDVGIEVIDPLGAKPIGNVLESCPLHGCAQLDDPVAEDPAGETVDWQFRDLDDRVEGGSRQRCDKKVRRQRGRNETWPPDEPS